MARVVLIDYGSGNLRSAEKALVRAAEMTAAPCEVEVTADPEAVAGADRLMLPGVGAFSACMDALEARPGLVEAMTDAVQAKGRPFLGVCVGMQLLADRGLEFGTRTGLGWIRGEVRALQPAHAGLKLPHVGWNDVAPRAHPLFDGGEAAPQRYYTHSYAFHPADRGDEIATTDYGGSFAAAVARDNVAGVQFHPEKSQGAGLALIARFLEWRP
jgi:imidazole glycerol-phosphate synthase subunit HisH